MEELRRNKLKELKLFFIDEGWVEGLFQLLFLLEDVKAGVYLQQEGSRRKLKRLRVILQELDFYVSMRHGGYATKNIELYQKWNRLFGFKRDAEKLLGYPSCCVRFHHLNIQAHIINLYSLMKEIKSGRKPRIALSGFLMNERFLHHNPCKSNCAYSIYLERKFEAVIRKYQWLVKDLLRDHDKVKVRNLIQKLGFLPRTIARDLLNNKELMGVLEINPDDVREIAENGRSFKENVKYGKLLLESFL